MLFIFWAFVNEPNLRLCISNPITKMMIKAKSVITDMVMFMNRFILLDVFANKQKNDEISKCI